MNGVFENTAILYALIKDAKVRSKEICIATLDFAKAFDSVPHSRILRALRKNNVDPESVDLISKMLTGKMTPCLPSFKKGSLVNSWLRGNSGMRSRDYITGLKLRFRVIETRSQKWRGRTPQNPDALLCRHCGHSSGYRETAADVSQKCLVTQALIIQRNNKIVRLVGVRAKE
ncbi:Retrovirus-related Pol polyprotein from type-1 retrotransposable element [Trichinella sp. T9]|nr:Retrovirus-related Pol polyprotein from type-1 retrotransposable element [Trichinella sp. T9]